MKLIFYDRSATPAVAPSEALLTIERKGIFSFGIGAVDRLPLKPEQQVVLAQDAETNQWYLLLTPLPTQHPFTLRPRDGKGKRALLFCSQPQARAYYQAHGLGEQKSVRAAVGLEPVRHEQLVLYPLHPQHPTLAVAAPAAAAPAAVDEVAEAPKPAVPGEPAVAAQPEQPAAPARPASMYTAEMDATLLAAVEPISKLSQEWDIPTASLYARRSYLKKKLVDTPAAVEVTPAAAAPTLIYTPATGDSAEPAKKTFGLLARAQELGAYWHEREISKTTPGELAEILNLLRHVPSSKLSTEMSLVLTRAEAEQQHRLTAAGKGGTRG